MLIEGSQDICEDSAWLRSSFEVGPLDTKLAPALLSLDEDELTQESRHVRFNEEANVYHENAILYTDERSSLWYSVDEFNKFTDFYNIECRAILKTERDLQAHRKAYSNVLTRVYLACQMQALEKLHPMDHSLFASWVQKTHSRVGLERSIVSCIKQDRRRRRQELIETVMQVQQAYSSSPDLDEHIRFASQEVTIPAVNFAAHLAQARWVPDRYQQEPQHESPKREGTPDSPLQQNVP
eukprot:CAMPEP_0168736472 /NCGR_PEP_ID=MMETSP0724-20121128/9879_1 /TAXON_ID=265536 /ORGANISM="Amphiprora sp., Strain CCMP467" /LENGTH=238 /DNA_ID=CAMNT_0008783673 /DNA_START=227 /DNA_END=943 /DNA_ORIENTATION=+